MTHVNLYICDSEEPLVKESGLSTIGLQTTVKYLKQWLVSNNAGDIDCELVYDGRILHNEEATLEEEGVVCNEGTTCNLYAYIKPAKKDMETETSPSDKTNKSNSTLTLLNKHLRATAGGMGHHQLFHILSRPDLLSCLVKEFGKRLSDNRFLCDLLGNSVMIKLLLTPAYFNDLRKLLLEWPILCDVLTFIINNLSKTTAPLSSSDATGSMFTTRFDDLFPDTNELMGLGIPLNGQAGRSRQQQPITLEQLNRALSGASSLPATASTSSPFHHAPFSSPGTTTQSTGISNPSNRGPISVDFFRDALNQSLMQSGGNAASPFNYAARNVSSASPTPPQFSVANPGGGGRRWDAELAILMEMGITHDVEAARRALEEADGDVNIAVASFFRE